MSPNLSCCNLDGCSAAVLKAPGPARLPACLPTYTAGLWLLQPTPMAVSFMQAMVRRLMWHGPWQWEQAMW
jgi:hypothetical protein